VGSGQWAVGSGQWAVGSGQWAVGSGWPRRLIMHLCIHAWAANFNGENRKLFRVFSWVDATVSLGGCMVAGARRIYFHSLEDFSKGPQMSQMDADVVRGKRRSHLSYLLICEHLRDLRRYPRPSRASSASRLLRRRRTTQADRRRELVH
jgi:hypothetical protein